MALFGKNLLDSLHHELGRVHEPQSKYLASRRTLNRFVTSLPLGSTLDRVFRKIQDKIEEREKIIEDHSKNEENYQRRAFASSTAALLRKRTQEIEKDVKTYLDDDVERINLAKQAIPDPIIVHKTVQRPGLEYIPDFVRKNMVDMDEVTSCAHLENMIISLKNEAEQKEEWLQEQKRFTITEDRITELRATISKVEAALDEETRRLRRLKVAKMTKNYLATMNSPENLVDRSKAVELFSARLDDPTLEEDLDSDLPIDCPSDSAKTHEILNTLREFDEQLVQRDYKTAAITALQYKCLRTTHNLKRIAADESDESTLAALWFASLVFGMVDPTPVEFRQLAIEIAGRANKIDQYFPYWYSVGIFTPDRKIAEATENSGDLNIATLLFTKLEMYEHVVSLLVRRRQFYKLVRIYKEGRVSSQRMKNIFLDNPLKHIGDALIEHGGHSLADLSIALVSMGKHDDLVTFLMKDPSKELSTKLESDFENVSIWKSVAAFTTNIKLQAKILSATVIAEAKYEEHLSEKAAYDFYS